MKCLVWLALAACSIRCKGKNDRRPLAIYKPTDEVRGEAPPADDLFVVARPLMTREPVPGRFAAPLPSSLAAVRAHTSYPPQPYIQAMLIADGAGMRARLTDAVTRATAAGAIDDDLAGWYANLFGYALDARTCAWIARAAAGKNAAARAVFVRALVRCDGLEGLALITRDDMPDAVIVDWFFERTFDDALPYSERVARAAAAIARTATEEFEVRKVGFVFARMIGDEPVAKMTELQKSIADPVRRARIGLGMLRSASPAGRAIGRKACAHRAVAFDAMCNGYTEPEHQAPATLDELVRAPDEDNLPALAKQPRELVIDAATQCVKSGKLYERLSCLGLLADRERSKAVELAPGLADDPDPDHAPLARAARTLVAFPAPGALERELVRLGFSPRPTTGRAPELGPLTVEDGLLASGRMTNFDVETGQWPNEHDELMFDLARIAEPGLAGVVFEEVPPLEDKGAYELRAYFDGMRYAVPAENLGDWYDLDATLGLLNAVLIARKSELRFTVLPTGDQTANVVAGPAKGIRALVDARLIDVAAASDAATAGKEFEDRVFEQLRGSADGPVDRDVPIGR
jgi:hypothetical protein